MIAILTLFIIIGLGLIYYLVLKKWIINLIIIMIDEDIILNICLITNLLMIGISLIIQFIVYPSFQIFDKAFFLKYHRNYMKKMLIIVSPIMILEIVSSTILFILSQTKIEALILFINVLIWLVTFIFIVPIHNSFSKNNNLKKVKKLLNYNFTRTFLWIFKALIFIYV